MSASQTVSRRCKIHAYSLKQPPLLSLQPGLETSGLALSFLSMFSGAKNVRIGGQASFQINNSSARTESVDEGIRLLVERVVKSAMYNSGERFDAPTCHEETRTAIQDDLLGWADELVDDLNKLVTWLCGPAGAGKSAIAQTIAEKLHDRGQLAASFFFSRASGSDGRGEETNFIATLAYQLSQSVPATQPHIATAVRTNPLVFDLALRDQVEALIVSPLIAVSNTSSGSERPKVIVVDGLDECRQEKDAQRRVVDALVSGLRRVPHHSHKLFITSRPEYNIVAIFNRHTDKLLRRIVLDNRWNPDEDIRTFLNSSFADIRRSHFYFRKHPVDHEWLSTEDVETLVERSSGQFIYASVVLKYIKSEENYNPVARLNTILQLKNNGDRPYVELDALYHHIFSQIQDAERVRILTILHLDQEYGKLMSGVSAPKFGTFLSQFMGMDEDEIEFCLRPLLSLLVWEEGPDEGSEEGPEEGSSESGKKHGGIHYMHASLLDFLSDQSRSDNFCINMKMCAAGIVRRAISLLEDVTALMIPRCMTPLITILTHYLGHMPDGDEAFHIYSLLSNFNIAETMLCKIGVDLIKASDSSFALTGYLKWVLEESERDDALHSQKALLQPTVARIQTWLVNQFEQLDFHDLANTKKVDVWPFFAPAMIDRRDYPEDVSEILSSALEICGSSLSCHRLLHGTKFDLSNCTAAVLCFLLPDFVLWSGFSNSTWLWRFDLLGCHAMTAERYGVALRRVIYYLLQLPRETLVEILNVSDSQQDILHTPIMRLICTILPEFLVCSPWTTELYFLVMLTRPVLRNFGRSDWQIRLRDYISSHTQKVRKVSPFLNASTFSDYTQDIAKVEQTLMNLKIKTSLHELVEMGQVQLYGEELVEYKKLLTTFTAIDRRVPDSG